MNHETWRATAGGGTLLKDLTQRMHDAGNRAMAHGICPQVGLGGHATIGGLGPSSRLWGAALDHVEEIEVVLADASIKRASETENADVFWAIKGAGASFGVVTEFVLRTEPEPGEAVQYSYSFTFGSYKEAAPTFKAWQAFVADPNLTRNFASEVIFTEAGMIVSGTYFGTKDEYDTFNMDSKFPGHQSKKTVVFKDWLGLVSHWAEGILLLLGGGVSAPMFTKSMTFNGLDLIPDDAIDKILAYMDSVKKGTLIWFVIFDLGGGKVNDIPQEATAYAHRDALYYMQSYAIAFPKIPDTTKDFLRGLNSLIKAEMPGAADFGAYPGYVDLELEHPQQEYWRTNLPRLEQIKASVDPSDVFHNPQSVRPAGATNGHSNGTVKAAAQKMRSLNFRDLFKHKQITTG
jgi:hypothetical protein